MSVETVPQAIRLQRRPLHFSVATVLVFVSAIICAVTALVTGEINQLSFEGLTGLFQRMVALGLVALGQTFVILCRFD